jgi:hypothetical protein
MRIRHRAMIGETCACIIAPQNRIECVVQSCERASLLCSNFFLITEKEYAVTCARMSRVIRAPVMNSSIV